MLLEDVIEDNIGLIHKISKSFYGVEKEDLYQAGVLGIIKAYNNYHNDGNTKFSSYAYNYIYGEMYNLAHNKALKINREILKLYQTIEKTRFSLAQKYGMIPSNEEVAKFLEISISDINDAIMAGSEIMSLDNSENAPLYESISGEEKISLDDQILLEEGLDTLNEDEKEIIKARYYEDMTQSEVARKLCMTQVMVSRYEKKGLNKMCQYLTK